MGSPRSVIRAQARLGWLLITVSQSGFGQHRGSESVPGVQTDLTQRGHTGSGTAQVNSYVTGSPTYITQVSGCGVET